MRVRGTGGGGGGGAGGVQVCYIVSRHCSSPSLGAAASAGIVKWQKRDKSVKDAIKLGSSVQSSGARWTGTRGRGRKSES